MIIRNGLSESLEEFAARFPGASKQARGEWRLQGLLLLGARLPDTFDARWSAVHQSSVRTAPGVAIPVPGFSPSEVVRK